MHSNYIMDNGDSILSVANFKITYYQLDTNKKSVHGSEREHFRN